MTVEQAYPALPDELPNPQDSDATYAYFEEQAVTLTTAATAPRAEAMDMLERVAVNFITINDQPANYGTLYGVDACAGILTGPAYVGRRLPGLSSSILANCGRLAVSYVDKQLFDPARDDILEAARSYYLAAAGNTLALRSRPNAPKSTDMHHMHLWSRIVSIDYRLGNLREAKQDAKNLAQAHRLWIESAKSD